MASRCPNCGSDQIINDECLKCGVLISKAHATTTASMKPISYVAPETTGPIPETQHQSPAAWRPAQDRIASIPVTPKKSGIEKKLITAVLLVLLAGGAYQLYRFLIHKASAYGGYYRNNIYYFNMDLPQKGWSHYQAGDVKLKEFKDAHDAFYRGSNPNNPDVAMLIWSEAIPKKKVPNQFDEETASKMLAAIEDEISVRMNKAGLDCEITESGRRTIGGNDGFVVHADVPQKGMFMKTIIYCGFAENRAYTIQFLGSQEKVMDLEPEIEKIMNSFSFEISIL